MTIRARTADTRSVRKSRRPRTFTELLEGRVLLSSTYYVSPGGSDAASGTAAAPFQTLQHAADLVAAGDTVVAEPGNYAGFVLSWDAPQAGTAAAPITFSAQPGAVINAPNAHTGDGIDLEVGSDYVTVQGFTVTNPNNTITRAGIRAVNSNHVSILNNSADHCGEWGVFTGFTDDVLIQGNTCSNSQQQHGIYVSNSSQRPVIRQNTVFGNADCGIQLNGDASQGGVGIISGALIEGNIVHDNGAIGGSAMNCDGVQNSRIQNNLLYNNHASGVSLFRIDGAAGSTDNLVVNNTIVMASNARWALNIQNGSTGNVAYNNILDNDNPNHGSIDISSDSLSGFVSDYNVVRDLFTPDDSTFISLASWQSQTGQDLHSLIATPDQLFVNAAGNDYHLSSASPAADGGTNLASPNQAPTTDLDGNARPAGAAYDIGAYERQAAVATPAAPSGLSAAAAGPTEIDLTWVDNSTNETGFRIERSTDGVNFTAVATVSAGVTSYADTGLTASTLYTYRVAAVNDAGSSAYSNTASAQTPAALAPPAAPSHLKASALKNHQILLHWSDNSTDETAFVIERSTGKGSFVPIATVGADVTSFTDSGLTKGATYTYRVRAVNAAGGSAYSNWVTVTAH